MGLGPVLVAEDEIWIRNAIIEMVEKSDNNYRVNGEAADGEEAWELINQLWPAILVTDIVMPKKDGLWLVEQIAENNLPILSVVISGYDNFEYAQKCIRYGVSDYLLKPVDEGQLHEALYRCTERFNTMSSMHESLVKIRNFTDSMHYIDDSSLIANQTKMIKEFYYLNGMESMQRKAIFAILASKFKEIHKSINSVCEIPLYNIEDFNSVERYFRVQTELWIKRNQNFHGTGNLQVIKKACEYINVHYNEDLRLREIADYVNLSISRFCNVFKNEMNTTFVNYLNNVRIEKAETLLLHADIKVYEVADKVGYISLQYFNKVFKNATGLSPNEFRKRMMKQ